MSITSLKNKYETLTGCTAETLEFLEDVIDTLEALEDKIHNLQYEGDDGE